jgi:hypothetical protein
MPTNNMSKYVQLILFGYLKSFDFLKPSCEMNYEKALREVATISLGKAGIISRPYWLYSH